MRHLVILLFAGVCQCVSHEILEWFTSHGGYADKVAVTDEDGRRFLMATAPIEPGEVIISVPASLVLDSTSASLVPEIAAVMAHYEQAKKPVLHVPPLLLLLSERRKGSASRWATYISYLPKEHKGILQLTEESIRGTSSYSTWSDYHTQLNGTWAAVQWVCANYPTLLGSPCPSAGDTAWALSTIWSRSFRGR